MDFLSHYEKDLTDKTGAMERFSVFKANAKTVIEFNKDKTNTWEMGINQWSDLTDDEFFKLFPLLPKDQQSSATNR